MFDFAKQYAENTRKILNGIPGVMKPMYAMAKLIKPKAIINENGESEAPEINPNQEVQMVNNYLEKSNVNPVEELILTLEHQRNYETHVKFIDLAKQMDEGGASLMRVPD